MKSVFPKIFLIIHVLNIYDVELTNRNHNNDTATVDAINMRLQSKNNTMMTNDALFNALYSQLQG